jgi:hypothetical protein
MNNAATTTDDPAAINLRSSIHFHLLCSRWREDFLRPLKNGSGVVALVVGPVGVVALAVVALVHRNRLAYSCPDVYIKLKKAILSTPTWLKRRRASGYEEEEEEEKEEEEQEDKGNEEGQRRRRCRGRRGKGSARHGTYVPPYVPTHLFAYSAPIAPKGKKRWTRQLRREK